MQFAQRKIGARLRLVKTSKSGKGGGGDAKLTLHACDILTRYGLIMRNVDTAISRDIAAVRAKLYRE